MNPKKEERESNMNLNSIFQTPTQKIAINEIPSGSVIDIGGGGEGVIGQIGGARITAIEKHQEEIEEAKPNAPDTKWVLADARDLPFSDGEFDNATAFFSGMYMSNKVKEQVFKEVYRVISNDGEFWIWDSKMDTQKEIFVLNLQVRLPKGNVVMTGYGHKPKIQTPEIILPILGNIGFDVNIIEDNQYWYFLKAKKQRPT